MATGIFKADFKEFIRQRFMVSRSSALLLSLGVCLPLQVFALLGVAVSQHQDGLSWDAPILLAIHATAKPQLDVLAALFTQLGIYWGVTPAIALLTLALLWRRQWRSLTYVLMTALGAVLINSTTKLAFHRPRPHLWELFYPLPSDYSFPSGHALSSMMLVVVLVSLTWGSRWCKWVLLLGSLFVLGIGWTRLYLGVHYPSDILAGWMLALAWAIGVSLWLKPHWTTP